MKVKNILSQLPWSALPASSAWPKRCRCRARTWWRPNPRAACRTPLGCFEPEEDKICRRCRKFASRQPCIRRSVHSWNKDLHDADFRSRHMRSCSWPLMSSKNVTIMAFVLMYYDCDWLKSAKAGQNQPKSVKTIKYFWSDCMPLKRSLPVW